MLVRRSWLPLLAIAVAALLALPAVASAGPLRPGAFGGLDCNGYSPIQQTIRAPLACADVRGDVNARNANTWDGHFYDNGHYIGHDEPDMTFFSTARGSGDNVTWTETLPHDPVAAPTVTHPGSDVSHWFELSVAPWFSMMICDPSSYPLTPCKPESDSNAPTCVGLNTTNCNPGGGSAFMEMQFYPPGDPPFLDSVSCDDTHWCARLTVTSLECNSDYSTCNNNCIEPQNSAYIQRDGAPTGPASPQLQDVVSFTPNAATLLMNPGDRLTVHMFDAPAPGGGDAFEVVVHDLTTGQTGYMQASAANGYAQTSIADCSGTPFNFQPEFSTASPNNVVLWSALKTNISTEYETGHWVPCKRLSKESSFAFSATFSDTYWNVCHGPYETGSGETSTEPSDAFCFPAGDTHGALDTAPDTTTGCGDDLLQNGDLDFDGTPYWPEWPTGPAPTASLPGALIQQLPTSNGAQYAQFNIQTNTADSEATCTSTNLSGCAIPPPQAPGQFYPYWSRVTSGGACTLEFGNVSSGTGVNDFGGDSQYGTNQNATLGYPEFIGPTMSNACRSSRHGT